MKKSILILLFALFTTHYIAAQEVNFIGKWVNTKTEFYTNGNLEETDEKEPNEECIAYVEFTADGKMIGKDYSRKCEEKETEAGTYKFNNGYWQLSLDGETYDAKLQKNAGGLQMIISNEHKDGTIEKVIVYFVTLKAFKEKTKNQSEKIKNYMVHYETKSIYMNLTMIQYSKNYGEYKSVDTNYKMTIGETEVKKRMITTPDKVYELNLIDKTGIEKPNTDETNEDTDYYNLSEEFKKENNIIELPDDYILGKKCKVFELTVEETKSHLWVWNNIVLKSTIGDEGALLATTVATKIDINPNFPAGIFQVPSDIDISEVKE